MNNNRYKIQLIEDDANIRRFVTALLEAADYQVITASGCQEGLQLFSSHNPDLVILDLGLPDRDGTHFLKQVRQDSATPIMVLSARSDESDKVEAFDLGANDYVCKPFGSGELLARIRSMLRNSRHSAPEGMLPGRRFEAGDIAIDYDSRRLFLSGEEIRLTQTEYNIMALLSEHFGKVLTYSAIIREIWGTSDSGSVKKLQVNMANIRRKLHIRPGESKYISNELGVGYRMYQDS